MDHVRNDPAATRVAESSALHGGAFGRREARSAFGIRISAGDARLWCTRPHRNVRDSAARRARPTFRDCAVITRCNRATSVSLYQPNSRAQHRRGKYLSSIDRFDLSPLFSARTAQSAKSATDGNAFVEVEREVHRRTSISVRYPRARTLIPVVSFHRNGRKKTRRAYYPSLLSPVDALASVPISREMLHNVTIVIL